MFKNTGGQCEENCKADFELFCPKHKRLEGDRIRKSNQRVREADTKRQKTVASVVDKTTIDRAVATEMTRETITYTTELADGGVCQRVCERKVEISHEESVRASNIMQVQKIQTNFESGDPATFLIRKRPSEVVNSWTPVNVMQHTFLEAAGYSRALFDHHSVVNMINDNKTGVFDSFNVDFEYSALNESAIVPECIWTFNFKTSTSVLSHGSDIDVHLMSEPTKAFVGAKVRFKTHCCPVYLTRCMSTCSIQWQPGRVIRISNTKNFFENTTSTARYGPLHSPRPCSE